MMQINAGPGKLPSAPRSAKLPAWVYRELAGADRAILSLVIFLNQLLLSLLCLWILAISPGTDLSVFVGLYGLWGLISAFSLFFTGFAPRVVALVWHLIFVGYVLGRSNTGPVPVRADDPILLWARYDLIVVSYLAITAAVVRYRKSRKGTEPSS